MKKFVYSFNEGSKDMKSLLGGKGANLAEMTKIGLPVPFGFTVTTEACNEYYEQGNKISEDIMKEIFDKLLELENVTGKKFGDTSNPLLVSVRSGAVFSMPGMMDTILNLGLNDDTVTGMARLTGNERFSYDSFRRFIQMYGDVVLEIHKTRFDAILEQKKKAKGYKFDIELLTEDLKDIIVQYKALIVSESGSEFPMDHKEQLKGAVMAVFRSWNNDRAVFYRHINNIPSNLGTAVTIQSMVFGNMGDTSGTGVAFTRSPVNGEKKMFGEFLVNAQGEDVVAGIRTPLPISEMADTFPEVYKDFTRISELLEKHYTDMQDMEFTVENNKLYMLQTRNGKRTASAAVKIAVDMEKEGLIDKRIAVTRLELSGDFGTIMKWADEIRTLKVRANADNPRDATQAVEFGAEGIGLCRTEHMFFEEDRIPAVQRMILADTEKDRREALKFLLPYQKSDFKEIFEVMGDRPVTIRLLDPPLHEFLPHTEEEIKILSKQINVPYKKLANAVEDLHEFNPMLGHRGCRLAVTYPEIAEMQAEAIIMAAIELKKEKNMVIIPEIMIPLVGLEKELAYVKKTVVATIDKCFAREGIKIDYLIGTMIEVPRAALTADEIAKEAEFFSFGTNDLTQMTLGLSRDDAGEIIKDYRDKLIYEEDPFQTLDQKGVGKLVKMAVELGKETRPNIKLGICGEHGGDPKTVEYCHAIGLHYVSCSPYRVPIARLAAAQAVVKAGK